MEMEVKTSKGNMHTFIDDTGIANLEIKDFPTKEDALQGGKSDRQSSQ